MTTPLVDERTAARIIKDLVGSDGKGLLYRYTTGYAWTPWAEFDTTTLQPKGASAALIGIFARWVELLIERLNQVPDKNFIAFLNMLGAAQLPPEPARVPVTFALAAGRTAEATVPQGTQVAAPADATVPQPSIFELERPLIVVAASLDSLVTLDPVQDSYANRSNASGASAFPAFAGDHRLEHILYIGDDELFGYPSITGLRLNVNLTEDLTDPDPRTVIWERWDGTDWTALTLPPTVPIDTTANLTRTGIVEFVQPVLLADGGLSNETTIGSQASRWLRCRLQTPITIGLPGAVGMVSATQLPEIKSIRGTEADPAIGIEVAVNLARTGITPDRGFANSTPLDLTNGFYPFGEKPKLFDAFYVASREAFSKDGIDVDASGPRQLTLTIALANSTDSQLPGHIVYSDDLTLAWEYWDGKAWTPFAPLTCSPPETERLLHGGTVTLTLPPVPAAMATVNGEENYFIRARIIAGNYGIEGYYTLIDPDQPELGYYYTAATFGPPIISSLSIAYEVTKKRAPDLCVTYNELGFEDVSQAGDFQPFSPPEEQDSPGLHLGFSLPSGVGHFPNATLSVYASVAGAVYGETSVPLSPLVSLAVAGIEEDASDPTVHHVLPAVHHFAITNESTALGTYSLVICGQRQVNDQWWTITPSDAVTIGADGTMSISVKAAETKAFDITVATIPDNTPAGTVARAFLQISQAAEPATIFTATFVTAVGHMPVQESTIGWEYWNGNAWSLLSLQRDESDGLTKPGLMQFTGPPDFASRRLFEQDRYWIRANFDPGDGSVVPRLRRFHLNTMSAIQSTTILNETLGSSSGDEDQTFRTTRAPVLSGQRLEVREIDLPTASERELLDAEEGSDAVTVVSNGSAGPSAIWVRWHEVPDFYGSGPRDRHYVMDHLTGGVSFGDGKAGWIPPLGTNNVRMASYRTGGGASGNRATGTVTQLKSTVPYVEKPTNPEPADGGAEAETVEAVRERVPRSLRHRDRAVTIEDYEDMAKLASLEVAHARCIPLRDLQADALGAAPRPGMASIIVVPRSTDSKPLPSLELLSRVETFVEQRIPAGASLVVVGPHYIRIDVTVEVAITADAVVPVVKTTIEERLAAFLHPLTGGLDGTGWDFGRQAHKSDLYPLIESVPGVDHTRYLQVSEIEELVGIRQTGCFLIYSGRHQVSVLFEEA